MFRLFCERFWRLSLHHHFGEVILDLRDAFSHSSMLLCEVTLSACLSHFDIVGSFARLSHQAHDIGVVFVGSFICCTTCRLIVVGKAQAFAGVAVREQR